MAEEKISSNGCNCTAQDIEENKVMAAIGYLGILFLIPLLAKKNSPYAQFHAKQGMALFVMEVAFWIVMWVLVFIPILGWIIDLLAWLAIVVFFFMGLINALSGKCTELPLVGGLFKNVKI